MLAIGSLLFACPVGAAVCHYTPPKSPREERIEQALSARALWGLPRSRSLVVRLDRDPAARRRGYALLDFPMTRREARYFEDRSVVEHEAGDVDDFASRFPGLSGGVSIEDDYPRGAYVLLHVTRRLTEGRRQAVLRLARRVRLRRVRWSERMLTRRAERTNTMLLAREGIQVWGTGVLISRNAVNVTYSSDRPDAVRLLRHAFGPALVLERVAPSFQVCDDPTSFALEPDGQTLRVRWGTSGSARNFRVEVQELPDRILIGGVADLPPISTTDLLYREARVALGSPLGDRPVISAVTHRLVPRRAGG